MLSAAVLALALARPTEVFEEWSLLETTPLREAVTVRAAYIRREGPSALLPAAVQGSGAPTVYALGHPSVLAVRHESQGWIVNFPPGERDTVHLIARTVRRTDSPRLFQLRWPDTVAQSVPVRRVATVPRAWMQGPGDGWTCPDEPEDDLPCVSTELRPPPLRLHVTPPRSPRGAVPASFLLAACALVRVGWREENRWERLLASAGGAAVGAAVALAVVGARWASWGVALAFAVPIGVLLGARAPGRARGRIVGGVALLAVPLMAVLDGRVSHVLALALVAAILIVWPPMPSC